MSEHGACLKYAPKQTSYESENPQWCQYCAHHGFSGVWHVCYNLPWWQLLLHGPKTVAFDGHCGAFRYPKKHLGRSR